MANPELVAYIRTNSGKFEKTLLAQTLKEGGWQSADIDAAFAEVEAPVAATPPVQPATPPSTPTSTPAQIYKPIQTQPVQPQPLVQEISPLGFGKGAPAAAPVVSAVTSVMPTSAQPIAAQPVSAPEVQISVDPQPIMPSAAPVQAKPQMPPPVQTAAPTSVPTPAQAPIQPPVQAPSQTQVPPQTPPQPQGGDPSKTPDADAAFLAEMVRHRKEAAAAQTSQEMIGGNQVSISTNTQSSSQEGIVGMIIKSGIAKDAQQANLIMIGAVIAVVAIAGWFIL